ncbi:MAG TPA: M28 family peptidase, partial [Longimicrobiaceae bacterium]
DVPANPRPRGEGPVVFGGYLADPTVSAAQELRPEQVRGSVLVLRFGAAPGTNPTSARFDMAQLFSVQSPAAAVVLVVEPGPIEEAWSYLRASSGTMKVDSGSARAPAGGGGPPVFLMSAAAAERLIGQPLAQARQPRTGLGTLRYRLDTREERVEGWNVVGVLPGSDPARAGEYVAVGAHYDHIGVGDPVNGDSINNGADDDGSGTVAVLEIAERFAAAAQRPARSLLLVWHTAEEEGLLGSEYFTDHPTVPRASIVAQLNIDMIGRNHPDSLSVVGSRRLSTGLGATIEAVNRRAQRPLLFDYGYDAPGHPEQIFCRSDHYNYARYGIPIAFFTIGLHADYHKPSDELEKIDFDKLTRVTQLIGDVVGEVANAPGRPVVDRPVPPLGTPCVQ